MRVDIRTRLLAGIMTLVAEIERKDSDLIDSSHQDCLNHRINRLRRGVLIIDGESLLKRMRVRRLRVPKRGRRLSSFDF